MILLALVFSSSFYWSDVGSKQALVCQVTELESCLTHLPAKVRQQLPPTIDSLNHAMARRGAMVLPLVDTDISGLILISPSQIPDSILVELSGKLHSFPLVEQPKLTLWHELGHLQGGDLVDKGLMGELSDYQHEWVADCYLVWRSAREKQGLDLAWQQYHRRNIDVMKDVSFMSHWTVPVLSQLLSRYSLEELNQFETFAALMSDFLPQVKQANQDTLDEFSSLIHRSFSTQASLHLPSYIYWRKPALRRYFEPSLVSLLGRDGANLWLKDKSL
ncbi:hypothetical protein [Shewanella violacea]|uniref:Uncharacterized protein n=1 Tax=Shewanella violacea (strain JCM 10179 / CIP 106290 / LMG 19151 / DSS12) TaxID=637905 RepID=D4ZFU1_SHEVD|nr:hypothetical protein [Shewanella violacea]BAJ00540.1 conserved hypothetical protein [Shewanella violacea DSS12]